MRAPLRLLATAGFALSVAVAGPAFSQIGGGASGGSSLSTGTAATSGAAGPVGSGIGGANDTPGTGIGSAGVPGSGIGGSAGVGGQGIPGANAAATGPNTGASNTGIQNSTVPGPGTAQRATAGMPLGGGGAAGSATGKPSPAVSGGPEGPGNPAVDRLAELERRSREVGRRAIRSICNGC